MYSDSLILSARYARGSADLVRFDVQVEPPHNSQQLGTPLFNSPVYVCLEESPVGDSWNRSRWISIGGRQVGADSANLEVQSFSGGGRVAGTFVSDLIGLQSVLSSRDANDLPQIIAASTGSFTASILDGESEVTYLLTDPLGGGMLFRYQGDGVVAFGFDVESLRGVLTSFGFVTKRDPLFELGAIGVGTGYLGADSPIEDFQLIASDTVIKLHPDGSYDEHLLGVDHKCYSANRNEYEDLISEGVRNVRNNALAVAKASQGEIYADITGGFDSRLVISGLNNAQILDKASFYSLKSSSEWETACGIARVCGRPISWIYPVSSVVEENTNFLFSCLEGSRDSSGTINHSTRDFAGRSPVTSLSGGYGETFRDFYLISEELLHKGVTGTSFVEAVFSKYPIYTWSIDGRRIFLPEFETKVKDRVEGVFERGRHAGARDDQLGNYLYLKGRNRFWIGQLAYWSSRAQLRFDILYSPELISAANTLDRYRRRANFVGLDAMRKMAPYLLNYPFHGSGHERIPAIYRSERFDPPRYHFPEGRNEVVAPNLEPRFLRGYEILPDEITENDQLESKRLGITPEQVYGLRTFGEEAAEALSHPAIRDYLNQSDLKHIISTSLESPAKAKISLKFIVALVRLGLVASERLSIEDRIRFAYSTKSLRL